MKTVLASGRLKASGVRYRAEFSSFNAYFLDSIKGIRDLVLNNAGQQAPRIAQARGLTLPQVQALLAQHTESRTLGLLGEARINVLRLNLAMDALKPASAHP